MGFRSDGKDLGCTFFFELPLFTEEVMKASSSALLMQQQLNPQSLKSTLSSVRSSFNTSLSVTIGRTASYTPQHNLQVGCNDMLITSFQSDHSANSNQLEQLPPPSPTAVASEFAKSLEQKPRKRDRCRRFQSYSSPSGG